MQELIVYRDKGTIDISIIERYEKKTGYRFPKTYKELLSKHNGLYPENNNFIFPDTRIKYPDDNQPESDIVFLRFYEYPTGLDNSNIEDYFVRNDDNALKPHTIVFGENAAGDMIAFDYSDNPKGDNPKIIYVYHDEWDDDISEFVHGYNKTEFIANSFEEFIDMLFEYNDEDE